MHIDDLSLWDQNEIDHDNMGISSCGGAASLSLSCPFIGGKLRGC